MPNAFAYIALFGWPLVAIALFRRLPLERALIWTILGGYLLLPAKVAVDFPLLPALDKTSIPAFAALALCWPALRGNGLLPTSPFWLTLIILYLLSPFVTVALNGDPIRYGPTVLPGMTLYDSFSFGLSHAVDLIPFLLARRFLQTDAAGHDLLVALAVAGLAYSLPALFEVRMSPQLHTWLYGFFPSSFMQQFRYDGFRPTVFLNHGLSVALFMAMALLAAGSIWRSAWSSGRTFWAAATVWLAGTLVLCKSMGAIAYGVILLPILRLARPRTHLLIASLIALSVLFYPLLRGAGLAPVQSALKIAESIDPERAESLAFRLRNEDLLLDHANERPLLGWGGYGRSRVFDSNGVDISVTDGAWVITVGCCGWIGYLGKFGILTLPIVIIWFRNNKSANMSRSVGYLAIVLSTNLIDLIPNAGLTPLTWLLAGALAAQLRAAVFTGSGRGLLSKPFDGLATGRSTPD